jgi:hypothetical protein
MTLYLRRWNSSKPLIIHQEEEEILAVQETDEKIKKG